MEFNDLQSQYQDLKQDIDRSMQAVLNESNYILGRQVEELEKQLSEYVGVKHVVGCSDGTAALQMIYMAYGIGRGDAVFCPDMTFFASIEPACMLGATPVFCDIGRESYNLCPLSLERQIQNVIKKGELVPRMIVAVDFIGNPADYDALREIALRYDLILAEDAAQGMGASYKGRKCGSFGNIAATSFFPSKPLGCYGDGGAVFTDDEAMWELLKSLRVHGKGSSKYDNVRIGLNSRLDTLQAAVLLPKLKRLEEEIERRQYLAARYNEACKGKYIIPAIQEDAISSYAQYVLLAQDKAHRDSIRKELESADIPTLIYYPNPLHTMKVFENNGYRFEETYENTINYSERTFALPFSAYLNEADQDRVIKALLRL